MAMNRLLLTALAAALLALPASAYGRSDLRLRGTVTATNAAEQLVTVTSSRLVHVLHVPGSLADIRVGRRVELRGTTLRARGNGSRVLARGVQIVRSELRAQSADVDGRVEARGRISSLSPLTVAGVTCTVPAGLSLARFSVGQRVEMKCDFAAGVLTLRRLESEDDDRDDDDRGQDRDDDDDGDHGGRGRG
jgi:hypothetical protein